MTICAHRTDTPGFFTPCIAFGGTCACAEEVRAETEEESPSKVLER